MSFLETPRFPDRIAIDAEGGPTFMTDVVIVESGHEQRNQAWSQARAMYDVSHVVKTPEFYQPLIAFFRAVNGRTHGFRFKDWHDFQCPDFAGVGVFTLLTATTFQMTKRYTTGALTHDRFIRKPISPIVISGGVVVSPVIDYTTGIVTVSSGTPTSWTGEFDVPCRFDIDQMRALTRSRQPGGGELLIEWATIPIIEIRV